MSVADDKLRFRTASKIRELLLHEVVFQVAELNPEFPFAFTLDCDNPDAQIETISYKQLALDVVKVAETLGKDIPRRTPGDKPLNVGLLGRSSYKYAVQWIACSFNSWIPTLISPKNSRDAVKHLLSISNATYFLVEKDFLSYAQSLELTIPLVVFEDLVQHSSIDLNFDFSSITAEQREAERRMPAFYLHTSGSTGHPKIIPETHEVFTAWMDSHAHHDISGFCNRPLFPNGPLYHAYGCWINFLWGVATGSPNFLVRSAKPFTGESVLRDTVKLHQYLQTTSIERFGLPKEVVIASIPSIGMEIAATGLEAIDTLAKYSKAIMLGGAGTPLDIGNLMTERGVNVMIGYGSTETGTPMLPVITDKPMLDGEWQYTPFRGGYEYHWLDTPYPEKKQLVVVPGRDSPAVFNHENPRGYNTSDIWVEHPTKKGWYRHDNRIGDVTVLSNGEKTDNKQLEGILLTSNRKIANVIVFGTGRAQNGILISPTRPISSDQEYLDEIWPTIERMNQIVPAHSRVVRELVVIEDIEHPFALTDKGTVRERVTRGMYTERIDEAYENLENSQPEGADLPSTFEREDIILYLQRSLNKLLSDRLPASEADLFEHGMDSLLAVRFQSSISQLLRKASSTSTMPRNVIYKYPSVDKLADFIVAFISSSASHSELDVEAGVQDRFHACVERFTTNLVPRLQINGANHVVLTGTTGSLGSFLLEHLLSQPNVERIYCFNRRSSMETSQRQIAGFKDRGLDSSKLEAAFGERVKLYDVDLPERHLGLSDADYEEIRTRVTHIIHGAWQLNFNLPLEGFERVHIAGVRHLIDLALSSPKPKSPHFMFLSSISATAGYRGSGDVPEERMNDVGAESLGYGLSKLAGERITETACEKAGLNASIVRIGQISGSTGTGAWAQSEYMPILFRSCFALGQVPADLPDVRWIPVDVAASVVSHLTFDKTEVGKQPAYYHLENPTCVPWSTIADAISQYRGMNLSKVAFASWLSDLRAKRDGDAEKIPALRLLDFFEGLEPTPPLIVEKTMKLAPEVNYGTISPALVAKYLEYQRI